MSSAMSASNRRMSNGSMTQPLKTFTSRSRFSVNVSVFTLAPFVIWVECYLIDIILQSFGLSRDKCGAPPGSGGWVRCSRENGSLAGAARFKLRGVRQTINYPKTMRRHAFKMKLKPGFENEYRK